MTLASLFGMGAATACTAILGIEAPPPTTEPDLAEDAGAADAASACTTTGSSDFFDAGEWRVLDLGRGFIGGCAGPWPDGGPPSDGQAEYLFLAGNPPIQVRTSSAGPASTVSASSTEAGGFVGALCTETQVLFVPSGSGTPVRAFSVSASFDGGAGWQSYRPEFADGGSFQGAAMSGGTIFFAPSTLDGTPSDLAMTYAPVPDGGLDAPTWKPLYLADGGTAARGFAGVVVDGQGGTVFVPSQDDEFGTTLNNGDSSAVVRVVKGVPSSFDMTAINGELHSFRGGASDGTYVYLAPNRATAVVARYDSGFSLENPAAWSAYDTTPMNPPLAPQGGALAGGFFGAGFDGRYVYFAPNARAGQPSVLRYDITQPFTAECAWSKADIGPLSDGGVAAGFAGVIYDGLWVYFIPTGTNTTLVAFKAGRPGSKPLPTGGSFL